MSVSITFEPSGIGGDVAQGTYLIDAARRLGVSLGIGCTSGKGDCPSCLVTVSSGVELLSSPSGVEERLLGPDLLSQSHRMACQTKIENHGDLVIKVVPPKPRSANDQAETDLLKTFSELPLNKKIAALLQFEALTMSQAFDSAIEKPLALGSRAFDSLVQRTRSGRSKIDPEK
jgi:uncharacterized 2Fe-2S/4Fe-4S cluster protein (DUF4445 family)